MSAAEIEASVTEFRDTLKTWILRPRQFSIDGHGHLWVDTTFNHDTHSYFDIWDGTEYVGSARVRDRLLAFDILGETLVTLVERPGTGGLTRGVDWYDISGELAAP